MEYLTYGAYFRQKKRLIENNSLRLLKKTAMWDTARSVYKNKQKKVEATKFRSVGHRI